MRARELNTTRHEWDDRNVSVAARDRTLYFTDSERDAIALTEAPTRIRAVHLTDGVLPKISRHCDETGFAALVIEIAEPSSVRHFYVASRPGPIGATLTESKATRLVPRSLSAV